MTDKLHPSTLGSWAACPKRAWHELEHAPGIDVPTIASWVGTAAHELAAGRRLPDIPNVPTLFDSLTPNAGVARRQAKRISGAMKLELETLGLHPIEAELDVQDEHIEGRIDAVFAHDVRRWLAIGDLKTGQRVPFGAWLQLGSYYHAYMAMHWDSLDVEVDKVLVLHIPRVKACEQQPVTVEMRDGLKCSEAAMNLTHHVSRWLEDETFETVPATPGTVCYGCPLTADQCAVRGVPDDERTAP